MSWLNVRGRRALPVVRQATTAECGLACLAMIAEWHGSAKDLAVLRREHSASLRGQSLAALIAISRRLGMRARAIRCSVSELSALQTPCILHWSFNHFVVLRSFDGNEAHLHDPARGKVRVPVGELRKAFTGAAMEVAPGSNFERGPRPVALRLSNLVARHAGLGSPALAGLLLALVCECLVLASPFYLQAVIDEVVVSGDTILLDTLVLAFSLVLGFQVLATVMRALIFQFVSFASVFEIAARILNRLMSLPVSWFRSRELGDIQHRFQALGRVQSFIVDAAPRLVIDMLFFALLVSLLFVYEATLTLLNVGAILLVALWRAAVFPYRLRVAGDIAVAEAATQTHFLESLRAIVSIKNANGESQRSAEWSNFLAEAINSRIRAGNLRIADASVRQVVLGATRITTIFMLATAVVEEQFTVGMLAAYAAYLGMLFARTNAIMEAVVEYRLLRVPLGRLADIVFSEPETGDRRGVAPRTGRIDIERVTFSYGPDTTPILRDCSFIAEPGEFIAIAGASGSGKSTLLQLLAGNELPSSGMVSHDGIATRHSEPAALRQAIATVLHDDCLVRGSVADNIALFDDAASPDAMHAAARLAEVHEEITALPMQYQTRIGDMGSVLSRGQVQRVLLARAYYREPKILLLDEATSGLDAATEKRVVDALSELSMTRVVVTHSEYLLAAADRVLWLKGGSLT